MLGWDLTYVPSGTDRRPGVSTSTTRDGRRGLRAIECGKPACVESDRLQYFFDIDSGELKDTEAEQFEILGMPEPPPGKSVAGVDVVVRLKSTG